MLTTVNLVITFYIKTTTVCFSSPTYSRGGPYWKYILTKKMHVYSHIFKG